MKILFGFSMLFSLAVLADPTKPAPSWQGASSSDSAVSALQAESLQLQIIRTSGAGNVAVINGRQLRRGDKLNQYNVLSITADQVVLELNGERKILQLVNTAIKLYE
ncbi:hypothetical protein [Rheinheimera maricola]|uniref:General secretion pathway protein GspB n=1 Tax=Rheinheimera maricola TaxID=2793282 RepID=A0ABS7XER5_9GAMM|nr:hypothetical protein [Rheinheimera maricola]MBZ9613821.1 general secretion pathway protein GspB [Rheinheimera maricola]